MDRTNNQSEFSRRSDGLFRGEDERVDDRPTGSKPFVGLPTARRRETAFPIAGILVDLIDYQSVVREILRWKENHERHYCCFTNPHSVSAALRDPEMLVALNSAGLTLPDGVGTILAATILGYRHCGRVTGPSAMLEMMRIGIPLRLRHYFFGGAPGVADRLATALGRQFPGLAIAGTQSPPFHPLTDQETDACIEAINRTRPDIVWVGLGTMKQEKWMYRNCERVETHAIMGVGAAFDFHSGNVPWAPGWIRRLGLEWAYRLYQEPARLWPRNLDSLVFLVRVLRQALLDGRPEQPAADPGPPRSTPVVNDERQKPSSSDDLRKAA